jgi:hypothetical protein
MFLSFIIHLQFFITLAFLSLNCIYITIRNFSILAYY